MPEFNQRYGSEAQCQAALQAARWPNGFVCPSCGGAARTSFVRRGLPYWQCGTCAHQCSLISSTIFESTKLPLSRWFLAMQLLTQSKNNVSALELMRQLGVSYHTAWLIKHKIMEAMRLREEPRELDGRVEIDDAYLGGERTGGKTGRGSENKVPSWQRCKPPRMASPCWHVCARSRTRPRQSRSSPPSTSPPLQPWFPTGCGAHPGIKQAALVLEGTGLSESRGRENRSGRGRLDIHPARRLPQLRRDERHAG